MKFREIPKEPIEATRWFKNSDHFAIIPYRGQSEPDGNDICTASACKGDKSECGARLHEHGWLDSPWNGQHRICPGDWIVTRADGRRYPVRDPIFRNAYEPVDGDWPED